MSMSIPSISSNVIEQKEFVLKTNSKDQVELQRGVQNLSPPSIYSSEHGLCYSFYAVKGDRELGLNLSFYAAIGATGLMLVSNSSFLEGVGMGAIAWYGTAFAIIGLMKIKEKMGYYLPTQSEKYFLPINSAGLQTDVIESAKQKGNLPHKFIDPISREIITTPVIFPDDPSNTIYDLETVKDLKKNKILINPIVRSHRLDFDKLVYLPVVKNQIDEITPLLKDA